MIVEATRRRQKKALLYVLCAVLKISYFELNRLWCWRDADHRGVGIVSGTDLYMAPEVGFSRFKTKLPHKHTYQVGN